MTKLDFIKNECKKARKQVERCSIASIAILGLALVAILGLVIAPDYILTQVLSAVMVTVYGTNQVFDLIKLNQKRKVIDQAEQAAIHGIEEEE